MYRHLESFTEVLDPIGCSAPLLSPPILSILTLNPLIPNCQILGFQHHWHVPFSPKVHPFTSCLGFFFQSHTHTIEDVIKAPPSKAGDAHIRTQTQHGFKVCKIQGLVLSSSWIPSRWQEGKSEWVEMLGQNLGPSVSGMGRRKRKKRRQRKKEEREWFLFRENFMITEKFCKMRFHCVILMLTNWHHFVSFWWLTANYHAAQSCVSLYTE